MKGIKSIFKRQPKPNWERRNKMVQCWTILWDNDSTAVQKLEAAQELAFYQMQEP